MHLRRPNGDEMVSECGMRPGPEESLSIWPAPEGMQFDSLCDPRCCVACQAKADR